MAQAAGSPIGIGGLPEGTIVMSGGYVSPEGFPGSELAEIAADILRHRAAEALQYGEALYGGASGYLPLRGLIAGWLADDQVEATPDDIMIVTGAKQNLDMCARA